MAHSLLVLAVLWGADSPVEPKLAAKPPAAVERPYHELNSAISELFKREATSANIAGRAATVRELCALHGEIVADPRYATSDKLKEYRARIWSRLGKVQTELKQQLARSNSPADRLAAENAALVSAADPAALVAAESLGDALSLLDQAQGGPGSLLAFGGRAVPGDWGPELVDLIERTINPAFWDVQGGPGTIVYYAPLQCLVVRATSEVHGRLGGLMGDLRAAGR
ncbi:MAG: hypothetical protein SFU86_23805 [Pirellulaceae bacterium]|nr:hypothetical protein [Pirellulaceae bacterium]